LRHRRCNATLVTATAPHTLRLTARLVGECEAAAACCNQDARPCLMICLVDLSQRPLFGDGPHGCKEAGKPTCSAVVRSTPMPKMDGGCNPTPSFLHYARAHDHEQRIGQATSDSVAGQGKQGRVRHPGRQCSVDRLALNRVHRCAVYKHELQTEFNAMAMMCDPLRLSSAGDGVRG
jgi:hypothetical protein